MKGSLRRFYHALRSRQSFIQNVAAMSVSSVWSIVIQIVFFPILSRIYSPEVYGGFAVLNSIVLIAGSLVTLSYDRALVLPRAQRHFRALMRLCLVFSAAGCLVITVITLLFGLDLNRLLNIEFLGYWVYAIGPLVFAYSLDRIALAWRIRDGVFRRSVPVEASLVIGTKIFNVGYGTFINAGAGGLILTTALLYFGRFFFFVSLLFKRGFSQLAVTPSRRSMREVKAEYQEYPRYILSSGLLNTASNYLPVLLLPVLTHSADAAGFFTFALVILDLPVRLLGSGVSSVFLKKSNELRDQDPERLAEVTSKLFTRLAYLSAIVFVVIYASGPWMYTLLFGEEWTEAGVIGAILVVSYFFRYVSMPISSLHVTGRKEKRLFGFQAALFIGRLAGLVVPALMGHDLYVIVWVYSIITGILYFAFALDSVRISGAKIAGNGLLLVVLLVLSLLMGEGLKFLLF